MIDREAAGERAEILPRPLGRAAVLFHHRIVMVGRHQNIRERLIVAQQDVEARLSFLDEIGFEQKRLDFRVRADEFHRHGLGHHPFQAVRQFGDLGIIHHPALERPRLADIERIPLGIQHTVHSRAFRQGLRPT